jgi:HD superfamily phosphohydrolase
MYWQVYLHKTNIAAEQMLIQTLKRAKYLYQENKKINVLKSLEFFLKEDINLETFTQNNIYLENFAAIDDNDIWTSLKLWKDEKDFVLKTLSTNLLERKIFKINISAEKEELPNIITIKQKIAEKYNLDEKEIKYFVREGIANNEAYQAKGEVINILSKNGHILDIAQASDLPNIKALKKIVKKYYVCYLRD